MKKTLPRTQDVVHRIAKHTTSMQIEKNKKNFEKIIVFFICLCYTIIVPREQDKKRKREKKP